MRLSTTRATTASARRPAGCFGVRRGEIYGATGFRAPDWSLRSFEIGYWLRPAAVGHGFVTEAVQLLVDLAFGHLEARRVLISCDPRNEPSRKVAERAGFVREGRLRNAALAPDGEPRDALVFALVPEDWHRLRDEREASILG
jgi:ribosomal-protein-serine acetyltransferase